jgi:hypothetical protein
LSVTGSLLISSRSPCLYSWNNSRFKSFAFGIIGFFLSAVVYNYIPYRDSSNHHVIFRAVSFSRSDAVSPFLPLKYDFSARYFGFFADICCSLYLFKWTPVPRSMHPCIVLCILRTCTFYLAISSNLFRSSLKCLWHEISSQMFMIAL